MVDRELGYAETLVNSPSEQFLHVCEYMFVLIFHVTAHFDVETNLFVPAVENLEKRLRSKLAVMDSPDDNKNEESDPQLESLSDREKDIIRFVALGMANKEIADRLCLSIHTVTTHRRNLSAKLGIHSPAGLTIFAILHHLVDLKDVNPHQ